jgi:hypothetical protein
VLDLPNGSPDFECDGAYAFCEDELREMVHQQAHGSDWKRLRKYEQ